MYKLATLEPKCQDRSDVGLSPSLRSLRVAAPSGEYTLCVPFHFYPFKSLSRLAIHSFKLKQTVLSIPANILK